MKCRAVCQRCLKEFSWEGLPSPLPACAHCGFKPRSPEPADDRIARRFKPEATPAIPGLETPLLPPAEQN